MIRIQEPEHGAVLNHRHGAKSGRGTSRFRARRGAARRSGNGERRSGPPRPATGSRREVAAQGPRAEPHRLSWLAPPAAASTGCGWSGTAIPAALPLLDRRQLFFIRDIRTEETSFALRLFLPGLLRHLNLGNRREVHPQPFLYHAGERLHALAIPRRLPQRVGRQRGLAELSFHAYPEFLQQCHVLIHVRLGNRPALVRPGPGAG